MLNQEQFEGKWTEIKGGIRNMWGQITDDELESAKGNLQAVAGIVQTKYAETKDSITEKIERLMDSFDNETDKSLKLNDGISSYQRSPTEIRTSSKSQTQDTASDVPTRSKERAVFEKSDGGAINAKQEVAGFDSVGKDNQDDDYDTEEIFDDGEKEDQTYEARKGNLAEDRITRH